MRRKYINSYDLIVNILKIRGDKGVKQEDFVKIIDKIRKVHSETNTFKNYKTRRTKEMQILANKISDETFNGNVLLAQNRQLSDRSTALRVKVENEVQEKPQVRVNVNVNEDIDLDQIASRLHELSNFKNNRKQITNEPIEGDFYE